MNSGSIRRQLAHASFWTIAGTAVNLVAGVLSSIAAARILGESAFGELSMTKATLVTLTMICGTSLVAPTSRAVAAVRASDRGSDRGFNDEAGRVIGFFLDAGAAVSLVATIGCIVLAGPIAAHLAAPQLSSILALSAPFVLFASLASVQTAVLGALGNFSSAGRLLAFEGILSALLVTLAAWISGLAAAMLAMVVAAAIAFAVRQRVLHQICRAAGITIHYRAVRAQLALVGALVVPSLLYTAAGQPFAWLARALLARSGGLVEVGVFAAAYAWGTTVLHLPGHVARPAMPILTNLLASGKTAEYRRLLRDILLFTLGASLLVAIPLMIASPWIMGAYGPSFRHGAIALVLVAFSSIIGAVSGALRSALLAAGIIWGQSLQALLWGMVLVGTFLLLRHYGSTGLAAAYVVAFAFSFALQAIVARRANEQP